MGKRIVLVMLCFVLTSCAKNVDTVKPADPRYPIYAKLAIAPPTVAPEVYRDLSRDDKAELQPVIEAMSKVYVEDVAAHVAARSKLLPYVLSENTKPADGALLLHSTFKKVRPGNQIGRFVMTYLVGLPIAGKPLIEMEFTLIDGATGKVIDTEEEQRDSAWRMGAFKDDLSIMYTKELAGECADFVASYMQTDLNEH